VLNLHLGNTNWCRYWYKRNRSDKSHPTFAALLYQEFDKPNWTDRLWHTLIQKTCHAYHYRLIEGLSMPVHASAHPIAAIVQGFCNTIRPWYTNRESLQFYEVLHSCVHASQRSIAEVEYSSCSLNRHM
jgi:hypothetical protein